jgi:hypothetical protein
MGIRHTSAAQLLLAFGTVFPAVTFGQINYVIHVSVDGGGSSYVQNRISLLPNFQRLQTEGAWTYNARCDYDISVTLPNHTTQVTARGVYGVNNNGHLWTSNSDPAAGQTIHSNKGSYVAGVFDVAHDSGLRTAMYATKTKFSLFDTSYNAANGAADTTGVDNGRDKIDTYVYNSSSASVTSSLVAAMNADPYNYVFVHYTDLDSAGHSYGWGSATFNNSLLAVDGYLGSLFSLVTTHPALAGHTAILLTADHGGKGYDHSNAADPLDYTIPFGVWGPGVAAGADLYALNPLSRLDPLAGRPNYVAAGQPIRSGDAANLELRLLGLGAIPGSTINPLQDLAVPEPVSALLLALSIPVLMRRRKQIHAGAA